jgi:hypothetical protein
MRWIGIIGLVAALVTVSADAMDTKAPCVDLLKEMAGWTIRSRSLSCHF